MFKVKLWSEVNTYQLGFVSLSRLIQLCAALCGALTSSLPLLPSAI